MPSPLLVLFFLPVSPMRFFTPPTTNYFSWTFQLDLSFNYTRSKSCYIMGIYKIQCNSQASMSSKRVQVKTHLIHFLNFFSDGSNQSPPPPPAAASIACMASGCSAFNAATSAFLLCSSSSVSNCSATCCCS
jgi:hypothetical protein